MREELELLEARYQSLQSLVGELLITNQKLRVEVAQLQQQQLSAPATHPPPRRDR